MNTQADLMQTVPTPAGDTPAWDMPAVDTPAGDTPTGNTPAGDTPAGNTPAGDKAIGNAGAGNNHAGHTHSLAARIAHWCQALAILIMIGSGWRIYDNVPIFPFEFPYWITLGGDKYLATTTSNDWGTGNAIAWHFAGMWLLLFGYALLVGNGVLTGHFRRALLPVSVKSFVRDFTAAATFRLDHNLPGYNAVQKVFYLGVLFAIAMMFASGLAIWKPVQLGWLTWLFGGFPAARVVHFMFMSVIVGFLLVHVALVAIVPQTLRGMVLGRAARPADPTPYLPTSEHVSP